MLTKGNVTDYIVLLHVLFIQAILIAFVLTLKFKLLKEPTKAEPDSSDERGIKQPIQFDSIKVEETRKLKCE